MIVTIFKVLATIAVVSLALLLLASLVVATWVNLREPKE